MDDKRQKMEALLRGAIRSNNRPADAVVVGIVVGWALFAATWVVVRFLGST